MSIGPNAPNVIFSAPIFLRSPIFFLKPEIVIESVGLHSLVLTGRLSSLNFSDPQCFESGPDGALASGCVRIKNMSCLVRKIQTFPNVRQRVNASIFFFAGDKLLP